MLTAKAMRCLHDASGCKCPLRAPGSIRHVYNNELSPMLASAGVTTHARDVWHYKENSQRRKGMLTLCLQWSAPVRQILSASAAIRMLRNIIMMIETVSWLSTLLGTSREAPALENRAATRPITRDTGCIVA